MLPLYDFKHPRRSPHKGRARTSLTDPRPLLRAYGHVQTSGKWWSLSGSNRRPEACKATALPAELRPHSRLASDAGESLRFLGFPRHQARRPVGLSKPRDNGGPGTTRTSDLTLIRGAL